MRVEVNLVSEMTGIRLRDLKILLGVGEWLVMQETHQL